MPFQNSFYGKLMIEVHAFSPNVLYFTECQSMVELALALRALIKLADEIIA